MIVFNDVLIPVEVAVVFLFLYPLPEFTTEIEESTFFEFAHLKLWFPAPNPVRSIAFDAEIASSYVLWSLTLYPSWTDAKYWESVDKPPTAVCPSVL